MACQIAQKVPAAPLELFVNTLASILDGALRSCDIPYEPYTSATMATYPMQAYTHDRLFHLQPFLGTAPTVTTGLARTTISARAHTYNSAIALLITAPRHPDHNVQWELDMAVASWAFLGWNRRIFDEILRYPPVEDRPRRNQPLQPHPDVEEFIPKFEPGNYYPDAVHWEAAKTGRPVHLVMVDLGVHNLEHVPTMVRTMDVSLRNQIHLVQLFEHLDHIGRLYNSMDDDRQQMTELVPANDRVFCSFLPGIVQGLRERSRAMALQADILENIHNSAVSLHEVPWPRISSSTVEVNMSCNF